MVEEFFQNKHSKKLIEFHIQLKTTGQNLLHLMLQYSPTVPPKFMLKRKDLTKETLNSVDDRGDSPLLMCARRNSRQSMYRVFVSKNVKGNQTETETMSKRRTCFEACLLIQTIKCLICRFATRSFVTSSSTSSITATSPTFDRCWTERS